MKAQRAIFELGTLGGCYVLAGIVALGQAAAAGHGRPAFGILAGVLGVLVLGGALWVIGLAVHRLREIQGLPETAHRLSRRSVAARVLLASLLPAATVVLLSLSSPGAGWLLGITFAVLGATLCAVALLTTHVEHLCGARVWRANHRFYFAR